MSEALATSIRKDQFVIVGDNQARQQEQLTMRRQNLTLRIAPYPPKVGEFAWTERRFGTAVHHHPMMLNVRKIQRKNIGGCAKENSPERPLRHRCGARK
jgi:hypothetical protein